MVAFGAGGIIGALSAGRLVKYIPQCVFMYCALLIAAGLVLFLLFWERQPNYIAVFMFALGWGYSEGTVDALIPGNTARSILIISHHYWAQINVNGIKFYGGE